MYWIRDIAQFITSQPSVDWAQLIEEAKEYGVYRRVAISLLLAKDLFDIPLQLEMKTQFGVLSNIDLIKNNVIELLFSPRQKLSLFDKVIFDVLLLDTIMDRIKLIYFKFTPRLSRRRFR